MTTLADLPEWLREHPLAPKRKQFIAAQMAGWMQFAPYLRKLNTLELRFALATELTRAEGPRRDMARRIFTRLRRVGGERLWKELEKAARIPKS